MKVVGFVVVLSLCISGCALQPAKQVTLTSTFNPQEVAWFNSPGSAAISGQALLRTNGGEARTCAGLPVRLVPKSTYAEERIMALYGNEERGFEPVIGQQVQFSSNDTQYGKANKEVTCDAQGNFAFEHLPAGQYFVVAPVVWQVGYARQGGILMQSVTLSSGEEKHLIMTR